MDLQIDRHKFARQRLEQRIISLQLHQLRSKKVILKHEEKEENEITEELPVFIAPLPTHQINQNQNEEKSALNDTHHVDINEHKTDEINDINNTPNGSSSTNSKHDSFPIFTTDKSNVETSLEKNPTDLTSAAFLQALREDLMVDNPIIEERNPDFSNHNASLYYEHENSFFSRFPFSIPFIRRNDSAIQSIPSQFPSNTIPPTSLSPSFSQSLNTQHPQSFGTNFVDDVDPLSILRGDEHRINDGFYTAPRIEMNPKLITKVVGRIVREQLYRRTKVIQKWWTNKAPENSTDPENQSLLQTSKYDQSLNRDHNTASNTLIVHPTSESNITDHNPIVSAKQHEHYRNIENAFSDPNAFILNASLSSVTEKSFKPTADFQYQQSRLGLSILSSILPNISNRLSLNIHIASITFHDHPLFTDEDRLCSTLRLSYEEFKRRETVDLAKFYADRIIGLRSKMLLLQKEINEDNEKLSMLQLNSSQAASLMGTSTIRALIQTLEELKEARVQRDQEEHETRVLFKQLYSKWLAVRQWRMIRGQEMISLGFALPSGASTPDASQITSSTATSTNATNAIIETPQSENASELKTSSGPLYIGQPTQLKVRQLRVLPKKEKRLWREDFTNELEESLLLEELKLRIAKTMKDPTSNQSSDSTLASNNGDQTALSKLLQERIELRMKKMRRLPGKLHYSPYLAFTATCLPTMSCVPIERKRRIEIETTKYYLALYVNNKLVRKSEASALTFPKFTLLFDMTTHLKLLAFPSSVVVHLMQCRQLGSDEKVATLNIPIPGLSSSPTQQEVIFGGRRISENEGKLYQTFTLNSGTLRANASTDAVERGGDIRYMQGSLDTAVFWKLGEHNTENGSENDGIMNSGMTESIDNARNDTRRRIAELTQLGHQLDPNDPRNASLLEFMRRQQYNRSHTKSFQISTQNSELFLMNDKEYKVSMRKKVLQIRKECGISTTEAVPLKDQEMSQQLVAIVQSSIDIGNQSDSNTQEFSKDTSKDNVTYSKESTDTFKRSWNDLDKLDVSSDWQDKAKLLHLQPSVTAVDEVVNESPLPDFTFQWDILSSLFKPRRGLQVERKRNAMSAPSGCSLIVQIVRGHNLPVRISSKARGIVENEQPVRTIVTAAFQKQSRATSAAVGVHPHWNEVLSLPLASINVRSISSLQENILFEIYDEIIQEGKMDPYHPKTIMQTTEHRWLGGFSIPFSAVASAGFMEGKFHIQIPLLHIGYERMDALSESYIHAYVTVDPPNILNSSLRLVDEANVEENIHPFYAHCLQWWRSLPITCPDGSSSSRPTLPFVRDIHCQLQMACRYISPLAPPTGFEAPSLFTRFVSQIPYSEDVHMNDGIKIWCSAHEFLALASGDWEEHATILACYFLHHEQMNSASGWQTYVVLGRAFPDGEVAYVLRLGRVGMDVVNEQLINPVTGRIYSCRRPEDMLACPLKTISTVISTNNIYFNLRPSSFITSNPVFQVNLASSSPFPSTSNPSMSIPSTHFALDNRSFWQPLFHDTFTLASISTEYHLNVSSLQSPLSYHYESQEYYIKRANVIHGILEYQFEQWRPRPTRWDHNISQVLQELLKVCEECEQQTIDDFPFRKQLALMTSSYSQLYGFPLHLCEAGNESLLRPTEDNPLVRALFQTKMHENEDESCIFALGVHAHPYPNRIASIWVYIVAMRL